MTQGDNVPSAQMLDLSRAWRTLIGFQQALDQAASAAREQVVFDRLPDEDPRCIRVEVEERLPCITLRVTLADVAPDALRAWATPDLVLLRATTKEGRPVERLIRLPAAVEREGVEIDRDGERFVISLEKRSVVPAPLWSAVAT